MSVFFFTFVILLAVQVTCRVLSFDSGSRELLTRQLEVGSDNIPPECIEACTPALETASTCTDTGCLCTSTLHTHVADCFVCIVKLDSVYTSEVQKEMSGYEQVCKSEDHNLGPVITISSTGETAIRNTTSDGDSQGSGAGIVRLSSGRMLGAALVGLAVLVL
ncbi:hypothetical protein C8Q76DRAFT_757805 [Earliella scabrosa]|nr:hypothetical protein C8Q76DRAFT_757805 [Earliella scabrosa]